MARITPLMIWAALIAGTPVSAWAQWRCDCTTIVDSCSAEVTPQASWIDVTTDNLQCARVDYFVDGLPFVTTVVEGQGRIDWMSPRENPDVRIQSCQVCADNAEAGSAEPVLTEEAGPLEPLLRWDAVYPAEAQLSGTEGFVVVEFDVTPEGGVDNAAVVESEPGELFDQAALAAVNRWRYVGDEQRGPTRLTERLEFSVDEMIWQLQPSAADLQPEAAVSAPRNQCIREDVVYNFGEMIEAGLINACAEPLLVYECAEGVGRQTGRWVCNDSERLQTLLVRPGDERIGTTVQNGMQAASVRWLTFSDNFFVARPPNSQYWWIACAQPDDACRDNAQMWVRSMDRQPASVDPRGRAAIAVARSY
ncbi:MAG: TonB family protein [Gammaproteobacteria bacterium]|nr:TonB family protein [Gammaproteobacteria bacterium]